MDIRFDITKKADIAGIVCFEEDKNFFSRIPAASKKLKEKAKKALSSKHFSGRPGETFFAPLPYKNSASVLFIGLGKKDKFTLERVRRAAAKLLSHAQTFRLETVRMELDGATALCSAEEAAAAVVEGARLSDYRFTRHKSKAYKDPRLSAFYLSSEDRRKVAPIQETIRKSEIIAGAVIFTRDLANEPPNVMTPVRLARAAKEMAAANGLDCKVLGKEEVKRLGMGGILAVSQGSTYPPQLVILQNKVKNSERPIVLVGKGITFDTGGISLKTSNDMDKMKFDMCGAAAVMGAMKATANLKLPVKVIGITPLCENMPGSSAQRPGDIIRCYNGKTVEVLNTDAEGRLILADALAYAERFKPRVIIDIATLTGACAATFSDLAIGLMSTDPELVRRIREAGQATGERCWELPLWDEYQELIRATYADIQNISKRQAGTITAGMFLKEFAGHTKSWAHLDIAGTAWNSGGSKPLSPIGATGVGVRLFVELLKGYSS